jgi:hypothetical protein
VSERTATANREQRVQSESCNCCQVIAVIAGHYFFCCSALPSVDSETSDAVT